MVCGLKIYTCVFLCSLCSLFFLSCATHDEDCVPAGHVLIVYMGGDNNLSGETHQKIQAIRAGWRPAAGDRLLIYQDAAGQTPVLMEVVSQNGQNTLQVLESYPEENSADSKVFARVLRQVKQLYPGPSYGLLVFSHASGWLPEGTLTNPKSSDTKSIITDNSDEMELADFAAAIPDRCFDYIVFEACFMAGIEVAYQLKDKANYILASSAEILSPGFTEVYTQNINRLFGADLTGFARAGFDYFDLLTGWQRSATFSIIRTSGLEDLAAFVRLNCDFSKEMILTEIQHFDRYSYRLFFDFEAYYGCLLEEDSQRAELTGLINDCVVWKANTPSFLIGYNGFEIRTHAGLTVYIPQQKFLFLNQEYQKLEWAKAVK